MYRSPQAAETYAQVPNARIVPYLTFDAIVGKNSAFEDLTEDELEELGGVELQALNLLSWAVPLYWFGSQALGFAILAAYLQRAEFRAALDSSDGQAAAVNSTWQDCIVRCRATRLILVL